jgi:hypothetical protein
MCQFTFCWNFLSRLQGATMPYTNLKSTVPVDRRSLLKTAGTGALALLAAGLLPETAEAQRGD